MKRLLLLLLLLPAAALAGTEDRVSMGGDVVVEAGEDLDGDVVVFGGDVRVDGRVRGDVVVLGGELQLGPAAQVDGDAVHLIGRYTAADGAQVGGSRVGVGEGEAAGLAGQLEAAKGASASARGDLSDLRQGRQGPGQQILGSFGARLGSWALGSLFLLVVGLLFLNTWPERSRNLRRTLEAAPGWSFLLGGIVTVGLFLLSLLLLISVVGWVALPFVVTLALGVWLTGLTGLLEAVGDRLPLPEATRSRGSAFVAGCAVFAVLGIPWTFGGLAGLLAGAVLVAVGCMAVGAAVLSGLGRNPYSGR